MVSKKVMLYSVISVVLVMFLSNVACASYIGFPSRRAGYVPKPRLISPVSTNVDLKEKDGIEFVWSPHESLPRSRKYYDFRLYNGYNMVESNLILKKRLPGNQRKIFVSKDKFKNGDTYTWSLRLGYRGTGKSSRSYHSFKVIK